MPVRGKLITRRNGLEGFREEGRKIHPQNGIEQKPEGLHDDFAMSTMMLSVDPASIRMKQRIATGNFRINGVSLAPAEESIAWGKKIIDFRANMTVKAIQAAKAQGNGK